MATSSRAWKVYLTVGLILAFLHIWIDPDTAAVKYAYVAVAATGPLAMVLGIRRLRRRGPWVPVLIGVLAMLAGDVLWVWYEFAGLDPFPSLADALYLPGYPLIAAGLLWMLHDNRAGSGRASLIDATIIATGAGVLSWVFLIAPYVRDAELTLAERAVSAAYPLMGILLVAVVARLGFMRRHVRLSDILMGGGLLALLIADTYLGVIELTVGYVYNHVAEFCWLAMYVLIGAATLVPEPTTVDDPDGHVSGKAVLPRMRLPALTLASLMAPAVLAWRAIRDGNVDLLVIAGGSTLLFLLVLARLVGLLRRIEEQASEVRQLAASDALTGLPNRRQWDAEIARLLASAERTGRPVCVAMLDLDHFKAFNDTNGHYAGDSLLRACSDAWMTQLRTTDLLARIGGDEFALALPDCPIDRAERVVDRLRAVMPDGETFSSGLAPWNRGESDEDLMIRADMALYAAKDAGRERTMRAGIALEPSDITS